MNKKEAAACLWLIFTVLLAIMLVMSTSLAPFLVLEAAESLPIILYSAVSSFVFIDLLVPNPRMERCGVMWLYWESVEHLGLPLLYFALSTVFHPFQVLFQFVVCSLLLVLYGCVFGRVETGRDIAKIVFLVNLLLAFWSLPTFVLWLDLTWRINGILTWTLLSAPTLLAYFKANRPSRLFSTKRIAVAAALIFVFGSLTFSPAACTGEKRVLLEHSVPGKIQVGSTVTINLQFTDQSGAAVELDTVTVVVTNPFGLENQPSLKQTSVGAYAFTQTFDTEGAYYITVRASKYGYISYSNRFLVDCVKSRAFLDWLFAVLNSPALFVFVIAPISALLLYRQFRKKRKK